MLIQLIGIACILLFLINWQSFFKHGRNLYYMLQLPGVPMIPFVGISFRLAFKKQEDLLGDLLDLHENNDICRLWMVGAPHAIIKKPEDLEVAMSNSEHITKGLQYDSIMDWLKEGLLTSRGRKWHLRRKMLTPAFHFKILEDSLPIMNESARVLAKKFLALEGEPADVDEYVTLCTLDVICETAMGIKLNSQDDKAKEYLEDIRRACTIIGHRETQLMYHFKPIFNLTPLGWEFYKRVKRLHNFTEKVISNRKKTFYKELTEKAEGKKKMAFLDCLIDMEYKNPGTLSLEDMREEVDTFMFEGHDTTSTSLVFTIYLLGLNKDVQVRFKNKILIRIKQDRVVEELEEIFGSSDRPVTYKDLQRMTYLEKVIKESLRLYPSVPYISRRLTKDLVLKSEGLKGKIVPSGTTLIILPFYLHRVKDVWPEPEKFDPERFSDEEILKRHPYSYIPFSAGPRNCIGQKFAMMELKVVLSTLLRHCVLESMTKKESLKYVPAVILRPNKIISVKFTPRNLIKS